MYACQPRLSELTRQESLVSRSRATWALRATLCATLFLLVACGSDRKLSVELVNETLRPVTELDARIGRATVSASELAPGVRPGPSLRLAASGASIPVSLSWRDGDDTNSWVGRIETAKGNDVEIALIGANLAVIRERTAP